MKITRRQLRKIIQEELGRLNEEEGHQSIVTKGKFKGYPGRTGEKGYVIVGDKVFGPTAINKLINWLEGPGKDYKREGEFEESDVTATVVIEALKELLEISPDDHPVDGPQAGVRIDAGSGFTWSSRTAGSVVLDMFKKIPKHAEKKPEQEETRAIKIPSTPGVRAGEVTKPGFLKIRIQQIRMQPDADRELEELRSRIEQGKVFKDEELTQPWTVEEFEEASRDDK